MCFLNLRIHVFYQFWKILNYFPKYWVSCILFFLLEFLNRYDYVVQFKPKIHKEVAPRLRILRRDYFLPEKRLRDSSNFAISLHLYERCIFLCLTHLFHQGCSLPRDPHLVGILALIGLKIASNLKSKPLAYSAWNYFLLVLFRSFWSLFLPLVSVTGIFFSCSIITSLLQSLGCPIFNRSYNSLLTSSPWKYSIISY